MAGAVSRTSPASGYSDLCAADSGQIGVVKAGVRSGRDVLGRGYATTNNGIVVTVSGWQSLNGDDQVLVRLPGQARYRAGIRHTGPSRYFVIWGEGQWFRQLGNYDRVELEAPQGRWRGPRVTIRYAQPAMAQALAWLRNCRL